MLKRTLAISLFLLLRICTGELFSQKAYFNGDQGVYELNSNVQVCQYTRLPITCHSGDFFSLALYKDTLYYSTISGSIFRYLINQPGSCQLIGSIGAGSNAMTADKRGMIYVAAGNELSVYDPKTNQLTKLGIMPCASSGDLVFYKNKLLLAGTDGRASGLYEINVQNPPASTLYMPTVGYDFYGILSFPVSCGKSKFLGLSTSNVGTTVVELDLDNKRVLSTSCDIPMGIYDACSMTEIGYDDGQINSIEIDPPCSSLKTASVKVSTLTIQPGTITYKLDNSITNTTGEFLNVKVGQHTVTTTTAGGCTDTRNFTVEAVSMIDVTAAITGPDNCSVHNGIVQLAATSTNASPPFSFTLLGRGIVSTSGYFNNLEGGLHNFRITSSDNCVTDTAILVVEKSRADCNDILVPGAFTPNNDGLNDSFKPYHSSFIKEMSMQIFNRWGQRIYSANGLGLAWDGKFNNVKQQPGAYVYMIRYTDYGGETKILKGTVVLIQ